MSQDKRRPIGEEPPVTTPPDDAALDAAWDAVTDEELAASIQWTEEMDKQPRKRPERGKQSNGR